MALDLERGVRDDFGGLCAEAQHRGRRHRQGWPEPQAQSRHAHRQYGEEEDQPTPPADSPGRGRRGDGGDQSPEGAGRGDREEAGHRSGRVAWVEVVPVQQQGHDREDAVQPTLNRLRRQGRGGHGSLAEVDTPATMPRAVPIRACHTEPCGCSASSGPNSSARKLTSVTIADPA